MLPVVAAGAFVGWLVKSARADAKREREVADELDWELRDTLDELSQHVGQNIAVLDAEGNERSGYKGRVHRVLRSKEIVILDVARQNKQHGSNRAQEVEFKVWHVRLDESFVELD